MMQGSIPLKIDPTKSQGCPKMQVITIYFTLYNSLQL